MADSVLRVRCNRSIRELETELVTAESPAVSWSSCPTLEGSVRGFTC